MEQTYKPESIIINIPKLYQRTSEEYIIPKWFDDLKNVLIVNNIEDDMGPITKLAPTVKLYDETDDVCIVTVDDDIRYLPHMLEDFARAYVYKGQRGKALGFSGFFYYCNFDENFSAHIPILKECHVDVLEGYGMVCYHRSFFKEDFAKYVEIAIQDSETKFSDDLVISNYLARKGVKRIQMFTERNNRSTIWSSGCVLPIGTGSDALHTGANGLTSDNNTRYVKATKWLMGKKLFYLSNVVGHDITDSIVCDNI